MKRITTSFMATLVATAAFFAVSFSSCTDYQDEIDGLDIRVTALEKLVGEMNTNLSSLSALVTAMDAGDYITNVTATAEGYIVTFAKAGAITLKNGKDGIDAVTPVILPVKDTDGNYYWQLNGEWMLDGEGNKVRANGKDGVAAGAPAVGQKQDADGNYYWTLDGEWLVVDGHKVRANGLDGTGAVAPQVRINPSTNEWEVSTDGGDTWTSTGVKATGNDGADAVSPQVRINPSTNEWEVSTDGGTIWTSTGVKATGSNGANAQSLIKSIVDGSDFVTITLSDDSVIKIPKSVVTGKEKEEIEIHYVKNNYYGNVSLMPGQSGTFTLDKIELTVSDISQVIPGEGITCEITGNTVTVTKGATIWGSDIKFITMDGRTIYVNLPNPYMFMSVNGAVPTQVLLARKDGVMLSNVPNSFNICFYRSLKPVSKEKLEEDPEYMHSALTDLSHKYFNDLKIDRIEIEKEDGVSSRDYPEAKVALEGTTVERVGDLYLVHTAPFDDSGLLTGETSYYIIKYTISITRSDGKVWYGCWSNKISKGE